MPKKKSNRKKRGGESKASQRKKKSKTPKTQKAKELPSSKALTLERKDPNYPSISLCMISKNEEDWIRLPLQSVESIVSEIILVDTGSCDRTVEIALEHGARVFTHIWNDDFSAARNISLEKASGEWILVLDADEAIAASDLEELQRLTLDDSICWEFLQRHYSNDYRMSNYFPVRGEFPEMERNYAGYFESNLCRLFPNFAGINYQGRIHELVEHSIRELGKHKVKRTEIRIHHYGHTPEVRAKKDKSKLYSPLGQKKLYDDPDNWKAFFEMAVEANTSGRLEESVQYFQKAAELNPQYVPIWVNMGYVLMQLRRFKEAIASLGSAIKLDPNTYEAYCNIGVVYMRTGNFPQAEAALRKAIELKSDYINAYCNLGKTLASQNKFSESANIYLRAIALQPLCHTALADLGILYFVGKQYHLAEKHLKEALRIDTGDSRVYLHLGQIYRATQRSSEALQALEQFCLIEEKGITENSPAELQGLVQRVRGECERLRATML